MIVVAAVARIAVLPVANGDAMNRMLWEGKVLAAEFNPYEQAPDTNELAVFRGEEWQGIVDKEQVSKLMPGRLWSYYVAWEIGEPERWTKVFLIVIDLLLCLVFAARFGVARSVLYAWNPLVIYCVGGLGVDSSLFLLPLVSGYLIWEFWVEKKGGISAIKAAGGIGSALGQMVCLSTLLVGLGVALNILLLPVLLWIIWHVLRRSGLRSGLVTLVFGLTPLTLSLMWASISLGINIWSIFPAEFQSSSRGVSLLPGIVGFLASGTSGYGYIFMVVLLVSSIWMIHKHESIERFASFYLIWTLVLATSIYPWSFLVLAVAGVGGGNYAFRVASLSVFAYFGAYRILGDSGSWEMPWTLQVLIWIPVLIAAAQYALKSRSRDGFYVHRF